MKDHRDIIVDILKKINPKSVLELGCGYGDNLYRIKKVFPNVKVVGIDIDKERVTEGMVKMRSENIEVEMSVEDIFKTEFSEKSFDVVLTDAVLLMIKMDTKQIKGIIQKIVKTARKMILLVEWHNERVGLSGIDVGERYVRNYVELLNMFEVKDIQLRKVMGEWDSEKWKNWGYYITAKL